MGLKFIGEVGVYLQQRDAIKVTAIDGNHVVDCYARRSVLQALGCPDTDDPLNLIRHFQRHRDSIEIAAMVKYRRSRWPMVELDVEAADLAALLPASAA